MLVTACGGLGADQNGTVCPAPSLTPIATPSASATPVTYGFLVDRAYTGDAKRSPSYPWPQLPRTALDTIAGALAQVDLHPGDSVFGAWISHNSNDVREIFLPLGQIPKSAVSGPSRIKSICFHDLKFSRCRMESISVSVCS